MVKTIHLESILEDNMHEELVYIIEVDSLRKQKILNKWCYDNLVLNKDFVIKWKNNKSFYHFRDRDLAVYLKMKYG